MALKDYFENLIERVESSDIVTNQGKDAEGFYKPTRTILLRHLNLLKDLHAKPLARPMLRASWNYVTEHLPPDWLMAGKPDKEALREMLGD